MIIVNVIVIIAVMSRVQNALAIPATAGILGVVEGATWAFTRRASGVAGFAGRFLAMAASVFFGSLIGMVAVVFVAMAGIRC